MLKFKLAIILCITLITAGCETTSKNTAAPFKTTVNTATQSSEPDPDSIPAGTDSGAKERIDDTFDPNEADLAVSLPRASLPDKTSDILNPPLAENMDEKKFKPGDETAQEKIDQALELCNYAQQMWETGKLDEALSNLDSAYFSILEIDSEISPELTQQKEDIRYLISKRILEIYASRKIAVNGQHNEIPLTLNAHVEKEIKRLTGPERKFFIRSLERSYRYRPFIVAELRKAGLPEEISWLPLIESGYKLRALSPARALGLWQFIPSTGYKFGLNRNYYIDERMDPKKATLAAISYLKELHNLFGDWTTALAAYNCGETRVLRTIRRQRINYLDNFWDLYQNLPRETARYVPRFLATLHIINDLDKYNIKVNAPLAPIEYQTVEINKQVRLKDIAKEIGVKTSLLKELNAELRYSLLPPEPYKLKIPKEKAGLFLSKIDTIKATYSPPPMYVFHRVRKGETVSGIAKKYRTTIRSISLVNNIKSNRIYAGKVLKIPSKSNRPVQASVAANKIPAGKTISYKVKRGDSLWNIARKFNTTTKKIMSANNLSNTRLSVGQTLLISGDKSLAKKGRSTYRVRSGDSPFTIAKKHRMSLNRLLALNQLSKRSKIFPGQKLIVE